MDFFKDNPPPGIGTGQTGLPRDASAVNQNPLFAPGTNIVPGQDIPLGGSLAALSPGTATTPQDFGNLSDPAAWMALVNDPTKLRAWVKQGLGPSAPDSLIDYYASKVKGQPGANPGEQAGSAQYWLTKLQADPNITGIPGPGASDRSNGDPWNPYAQFEGQFSAPTAAEAAAYPGSQYIQQQALQAVDRGASSKGTLLTGGTIKEEQDRAANLATLNYGNVYNQNANTFGINQASFYHNQDSPFQKRYTLSALGRPTPP